jgi:hypothetical protein
MPLKQTYGDFDDQGVRIIGENGYLRLYIDPSNYPSRPIILSDLSYAEYESGKKYQLVINPEELIDSRNTVDKDEFLFLKDPNKSIKSYKDWDDGIWTIYLRLKCGNESFEKNITFELDTFYYNPIIHGAPN